MQKFKSEMPSLQNRKQESDKLLANYSDKLPIILEPYSSSGNRYLIKQNKFLVPKLYTFHEFIFLIRKKLTLLKSESLFITIGNSYFPALNRSLVSIYNEYKDSDGFLYVFYSSEATWGG